GLAGDGDVGDGVAEGQDGVDVVLRDVALGYAGADAAAVRDGDDVLLGHGQGAVLGDLPEEGVGDEVAEVGLFGAVAGVALAVEVGLGLGEDCAVLGVYLGLDGGGAVGHGLHGALVLAEVDAGGGDAVLGDGDDADVGGGGAGGGEQGVADLAGAVGGGLDLVKGAVAVAVYEDVDAADLAEQVDGAVGRALFVDAQVAQADDVVAA